MRKEQYRALSKAERRAYLDSKKDAMADYYLRVLKPQRTLARLERDAARLRAEPSKELRLERIQLQQRLAEIQLQMNDIRAKMEKP